MPHDTPLIAMLAGGLVLAFVMGSLAHRLKLSPLVGYLLAGVVVGPFTPGFVGDSAMAAELAEIGVILLMFGVGLHFSIDDLRAVRRIAFPWAIAPIAFGTLLGWGLAMIIGWNPWQGLVFGLALSVASTVVLLRALEEHRLLDTERGKTAVGWLIVEDLVM
ncbi:MAG: cation:proton antiporter, partial [Arenimonas sp.]